MKRLAAAMCFLALAACGDEPKRIEDVRSSVRSATIEDGRVAVAMITPGSGAANDMASIAHDFFALSEWQMTNGGGATQGITALVTVKTRDRYGNGGEQDAFILSVNGADLERINWDGITHWDLMNLSQFTPLHRFGIQLATEWCADGDNGSYSRQFCSRTLSQ